MRKQLALWLQNFLFLFLLLLLPNQLGLHFWPAWTIVQGLRIDYLSPTLYLSYLLTLIFLGSVIVSGLQGFGHPERSEGPPRLTWKRFFGLRPQNDKLAFLANFFKSRGLLFLIFTTTVYLELKLKLLAEPSLLKLDQLLLLIALGVAIAKHGRKLTWAWLGLPLALIWTSLLAIFQFVTQRSLGLWLLGERSISIITPGVATGSFFGVEFLRPYAAFSHPNSLAGFVLVGAFLVFALKRHYPLWLTSLSVSFSLVALVLSASRVATLTGLFLFFLVALQKIFSRRFLFVFSLFVFTLTLTLTLTLTTPPFGSQSLTRRSEQIRFSRETFSKSQFFGVGLNNFIPLLGQTLPSPLFPSLSSPTLWLQPVHNVFLLVLVETGLVGFVALIFFLWKTVKILNHKSLFLNLAFLGILLTSLTDHYWFTLIQNQLLAALVFGLTWSNSQDLF